MPRLSDNLREEAAAWFSVQRRGPMSLDERARFDEWRADRQNQAALDAMHQLWGETSALKTLDVRALHPPRERMRHVGQAVAAVLALAVAGAAFWSMSGGDVLAQRAQTDIGEQRTATFSDGSVVTLNVVTRIDYRMAPDRRQVWMKDGEAIFFVHKDPDRPFLVHAGPSEIRAVGTAFNVRRRDGVTEVAVLNGIVSVTTSRRPGAAPQVVRLVAGQKLLVEDDTRQAAPAVKTAAPQTIAEWRLRTVTYEDATLADVVKDVNRFYPRKLEVEDPALANRRVTLRLQVEDRQQTLETLGALLGARLRDRGETDALVADS